MTEIAKRKYKPILIILLCSLVLIIIMQPWNLYFLNDDFEHIPAIGQTLVIRKNFLRPFANLFLLFDNCLYGKWAPGYFLTTWLLHSATSVSIYYASRDVIRKYIPYLPSRTALLTSLFFLFYPFHAEPLFWIIGRGSIIAALFTILSIYFYLKKDEKNTYLLISLLLFTVALLSYESIWNAIFFYCLISFLNIKQHAANHKRERFHSGIFVLTFIAYFIVRYYTLNTLTGDYAQIDNNIFNFRLLLTNIIKLTGRNFTPPFLNAVFSLIFFSLSVIIYTVAIAVMLKKNTKAGWLMIILWLGVISGVITAAPLGIDTHGNESERYIYYSSFFFCFFLAIATTLPKRKEWQYIINGFIITLAIAGLITYNVNYRYASAVTKTTLQFVKKYPDFKNAYFIDVPEEYKGALIFRTSLPDAIYWVDTECKYDSIKIISKTENARGKLPYETGEKTWEELSRAKGFKIGKNIYGVKDTLNRNVTLNKNDILFWFNGKGIFKVNRP